MARSFFLMPKKARPWWIGLLCVGFVLYNADQVTRMMKPYRHQAEAYFTVSSTTSNNNKTAMPSMASKSDYVDMREYSISAFLRSPLKKFSNIKRQIWSYENRWKVRYFWKVTIGGHDDDDGDHPHTNHPLRSRSNKKKTKSPIRDTDPRYSITRNDRSGMVITEMIMAYAYCRDQGLIYGGSCKLHSRGGQAQAQATRLLRLLGLYQEDADDQHDTNHSMLYTTNHQRSSKPFRFLDKCPPNDTHLIHHEHYGRHFRKIYTPSFVAHLQGLVQLNTSVLLGTQLDDNSSSTAQQEILLQPKRRQDYTVAIHIRRGDVTMCHDHGAANYRYLPSDYYLDLLDHFLPKPRVKRKAIIHVFSESGGAGDNWTHFVQDAHQRGHKTVHLHLDTKDLALVWNVMIQADLLIQSRQSTFSYVPAMLNKRGTIIYTQSSRQPLPTWKQAPKHIVNPMNESMWNKCLGKS